MRSSRSISIRDDVQQLHRTVEQHRFVEAIGRFYAPHASMQENTQPPRAGLPALLQNERQAAARFKKVHLVKAFSYVIDENRAAINWIFEATGQNGHRFHLDEIAYQEWQDGKIVKERFYYDPAQRGL